MDFVQPWSISAVRELETGGPGLLDLECRSLPLGVAGVLVIHYCCPDGIGSSDSLMESELISFKPYKFIVRANTSYACGSLYLQVESTLKE